ncbi:MAG: hypothetical protein JOS17DRAFT_779592 [Linnemannia elongata]|nr:MAG: hypothetical protein JOS17DRAFT_779592 [Linnemannia elongata]
MAPPSEPYTDAFFRDMSFFLILDSNYRHHLQTLVGDKTIIPLRVYYSSWISDDSKLCAFLSAHKALDPNSNDDNDKKHDGYSEQQHTVTRTTTTTTTKTEWVYALVIGTLVLNTCLVISVMCWNYDCHHMQSVPETFTIEDLRDKYRTYCYPSSLRDTFRFTFLTWPHPENLFAMVTAYFCAAAWSTLPT